MSFDKLRIYDAGHFYDAELPDWYLEAEHLSETEPMDWHRAFDRVLDCEHTQLTSDGAPGGWIEVRFWPTQAHGFFVMLETPLALVEQVVVPKAADWLPFLSNYLAPLMATSAQSALVEVQGKAANAFIAWARHGEGSHVDRETGQSQIDLDADQPRRREERARQAMAQAGRNARA